MREDIQKTEDKVSILGDIPLAGRLFRTKADQHIKRNLIMFVTASLLDPAGQPLIRADEEKEIIPEPSAAAVERETIPGRCLLFNSASSIAPMNAVPIKAVPQQSRPCHTGAGLFSA